MDRISPEYLTLNHEMHVKRKTYGVGGHKWVEEIKEFRFKYGIDGVLDYGAGKCRLSKGIPDVVDYDPCIPELASEPWPVDLVVCTDVLEHVEPECVDAVLDHIQGLAKRFVWLVPCLIASDKQLPDGSPAHRLVKPAGWWLDKFNERWDVVNIEKRREKLVYIGRVHEVGG